MDNGEELKCRVKWFDQKKGFGFAIHPKTQEDIFIHYSAIEGSGYKVLNENELIEVTAVKSQKGLKATSIRKQNK